MKRYFKTVSCASPATSIISPANTTVAPATTTDASPATSQAASMCGFPAASLTVLFPLTYVQSVKVHGEQRARESVTLTLIGWTNTNGKFSVEKNVSHSARRANQYYWAIFIISITE